MLYVITSAIFWLAFLMLAYTFILYPIILKWMAWRAGRPWIKAPYDRPFTVVMVVFNEEQRLPDKLREVLASDQAEGIKEIVVASDGSTDRTVEVAAQWGGKVRAVAFPERRGKAAVLNEVVPGCTTEVVVFMDVRQRPLPDMLRILVTAFADDKVGCVSGELVFYHDETDTATARGLSSYWAYEKNVRKWEGLWNSVPGATGACYAIRKELFRGLDPRTILDDVAIPMGIITAGYRCVFESGARVFDWPTKDRHRESFRKRRTIAGGIQLLLLHPQWLLPAENPAWFQYVSHKVLRLFVPLFALILLLTNLVLVRHFPYGLFFGAQAAAYGMSFVGWVMQRMGRSGQVLNAVCFIMNLNWFTVLAWWDVCRRRASPVWEK